MQVVLSATISRLSCMLGDVLLVLLFYVFLIIQNVLLVFWFLPCSIGTKLNYEITLMAWLKVTNSRYYCSQDPNAC